MVVPLPPTKTNIFMDEVLNFLATAPTAEQILAFKPSDALAQRSEYLFDRNRNGHLSAEEKDELDEFLRLNHFVNMLKIRTRQKTDAA
jgi:hypothetical protein